MRKHIFAIAVAAHAAATRRHLRGAVPFAIAVVSTFLGTAHAGEPTATAIEYYNATLNHYFMTAFTDEQASLDAGVPPGWKRTGASFPAYSANGSGLATVCRFFGTPGLGVNSHFYTAFDFECAAVKQLAGCTFECGRRRHLLMHGEIR